jgi:hypothetical protein
MKTFKFLLLILLFSSTLLSQKIDTRIDAVFSKFFSEDNISQLFSPDFFKKVSLNEIVKIKNKFLKNYGSFKTTIYQANNLKEIEFEKSKIPVKMSLSESGLIETFWFGVPIFFNDSKTDILKELEDYQSQVSICIRKDYTTLLDLNKENPMAIGSSFKLWTLSAIQEKVKNNEISWNDSITIRNEYKSLPSGILQNSPDGYKLTIRKAANLMISISDNTATDHLIRLIGRSNIEKSVPQTMIPYYLTKELFILKIGKDSSFVNNYINSSRDTKYSILRSIDTNNVNSLDIKLFDFPRFIEIEYYASTEELCKKIESLYLEEALSLNPGLAKKTEWHYIAYKGGSEPGVLNMTYLLQKEKDSPLISISASLNNPISNSEVNDFMVIVGRLLDLLAHKEIY